MRSTWTTRKDKTRAHFRSVLEKLHLKHLPFITACQPVLPREQPSSDHQRSFQVVTVRRKREAQESGMRATTTARRMRIHGNALKGGWVLNQWALGLLDKRTQHPVFDRRHVVVVGADDFTSKRWTTEITNGLYHYVGLPQRIGIRKL